ncbi:AMP-binding protein [Pseudonocardia nantongensis]|uniref:AMP-binding protein n=1 Tax=Pseudonocardia nantongensis TaxID=1181885 RepID=UPI00397B39CF
MPITGDTVGSRVAAAARDTPWLVAGEPTSAAALDAAADRVAGGLLGTGLEPGEHVCLLLRTSPTALVTWFALARAGLVEVPLNTATRGGLLAHLLEHSGARVVVADADLAPLVLAARPPSVTRVIVHGGDPPPDPPPGVTVSRWAELAVAAPPERQVAVDPDDTTVVLYTSGTTGPPKGVRLSHRANLALAEHTVDLMSYTAADRLYSVFPLFHSNARFCSVLPALLTGAGLVLDARFSASGFWDTCRTHGITAFNFQGAMLTLLHQRPETPADADNPVRAGFGAPCPPEVTPSFERRFGVELTEVYGSTEVSIVCQARPHERRPGSAGRESPLYHCRVVDDRGDPVPSGVSGEIVARPKRAGLMFSGYHAMPDATVRAWRDLWFRTGDRGRMDGDGHLYFLDRLSDSIRRRGENVSSWEIERALVALPDVAAAAAYGIASALSEEDVMVAVVPAQEARIDPADLVGRLREAVSGFALPRYVRVVDALPLTPSQRTEKYRLRAEGVTPETWDREAERDER